MAEYNIKVSKVSKQKKKQRATKKRKEFSKVVVILDTIIFIAIIIFSCTLMWKTEDTSALAYLIPSVFSLWAVCNGFYFWKARKENEIKLLQEYKTDAEKVSEKLKELGLKFRNEFSDAAWVYRFVISRDKDNMRILESLK